MNYFAYGSNMFTYRLEKRVGRVEIIGIGKLSKHSLLFNKVSTDGSLKANITPNDKDDVFSRAVSPLQANSIAGHGDNSRRSLLT